MSSQQQSEFTPIAGPSSSNIPNIIPNTNNETYSEQDHQQQQPHPRLIPIHFRLVPKDIWIRMHIDTRSTIGSVKDALLEKIQLPPHDPSLHYYFYDDARAAMSRQSATQSEVKSFPKAFVARIPKRNMKEIVKAEKEANLIGTDSNSIHSSLKTNKSINIRKTPNIKHVSTTAQARAILGGDPGLGGRGSMGFIGMNIDRRESFDDPNSQCTGCADERPKVIISKSKQKITSMQTHLSSSSQSGHLYPGSSSSDDLRRVNTLPTTPMKSFGKRPSTSQTDPIQISVEEQPEEENTNNFDLTKIAGLDAYADYYGVGLFGNEEAKNQEEAAMAQLRAMDTTLGSRSGSAPSGLAFNPTTTSPYMDRLSNNLNSLQSQSFNSSPRTSTPARNTDEEDNGEDDLLIDGQEAFNELVQRSGSVSLHSSSSSDSLAEQQEEDKNAHHDSISTNSNFHLNDFDQSSAKGNGSGSARSASPSSSKNGARERARSGTIVASEVQKNKAATLASNAIALMETNSFDSPAPSTINTSSSESQIHEEDMLKLPRSRIQTNSSIDEKQRTAATNTTNATTAAATMDESIGQTTFASLYGQSLTGTSSNNNQTRRLAGIYTDEISSWRDAQHAQARHYAVHSYSNGHILEDWRTVAALRIRPFELLEIQYADPHDKIHLPRLGEASDASPSKVTNRMQMQMREREDNSQFIPNEVRQNDFYRDVPNPTLENRYLEPFAEAWCYIFKRGGGTSKAQKAGLGLWKLRWISLRGKRLSIYRTKHIRQGYDEAMNIWNLGSIESVITERADGVTRPVLMPINGICQDILTINFARAFIPPNSIHDEASDYQQAILSMRFITQVDHCSFFRSFARAHLHTSLQSQDSFQSAMVFEWRRKAMARAVIAGMGGTVIPGKAGRRGGRNALSRQRLRPMGLSRDFDDADRWSSESEGEDIPSISSIANIASLIQQSDDGSIRGTRTEKNSNSSNNLGFYYTSATVRPTIQLGADNSGMSFTPSLPSMQYFVGSDSDVFYDNSSTAGGDQSSILHGTGSPPPLREMPMFDTIRSNPAVKTNNSNFGHSPLRDYQIGGSGSSSDGNRRNSAIRTLASYNVNDRRSTISSPLPPSSPGDKQNRNRNGAPPPQPQDLTLNGNRQRMFTNPSSQSNLSIDQFENQQRFSSSIPNSPSLSQQQQQQQQQQSEEISKPYSRSIVSNILPAEEQSPAAQAIHSFLAQRSASNATINSKNRSQTFGSPYSNSSFQFEGVGDNGQGESNENGKMENQTTGLFDKTSQKDKGIILTSVSALSDEQSNHKRM